MLTSKALIGTKRGQTSKKTSNAQRRSVQFRLAISRERADDGIRTRDLRFTKPLLYQLSYVGARSGQKITSVGIRLKRLKMQTAGD